MRVVLDVTLVYLKAHVVQDCHAICSRTVQGSYAQHVQLLCHQVLGCQIQCIECNVHCSGVQTGSSDAARWHPWHVQPRLFCATLLGYNLYLRKMRWISYIVTCFVCTCLQLTVSHLSPTCTNMELWRTATMHQRAGVAHCATVWAAKVITWCTLLLWLCLDCLCTTCKNQHPLKVYDAATPHFWSAQLQYPLASSSKLLTSNNTNYSNLTQLTCSCTTMIP